MFTIFQPYGYHVLNLSAVMGTNRFTRALMRLKGCVSVCPPLHTLLLWTALS